MDHGVHVTTAPLAADVTRRRYGDVRELIADAHNPTPLGPSTGAIVQAIAAVDWGDGPVVGISPDGGQKYASYFASLLEQETPSP